MNDNKSIDSDLGADFPGRAGQLLLKLLLPANRREELIGDLIEEAETVVLPQQGPRAARRWFWWQAVASVSPMHARHCAREVGMHRQRWLVVAAILVFGPLMAMDAGAHKASGSTIGLVAIAILIPAVTGLLSGNLRVHGLAALTATALLILARLSSGVELRWYAIPWIFFALLHLNWRYEHRLVRLRLGRESSGSRPTP